MRILILILLTFLLSITNFAQELSQTDKTRIAEAFQLRERFADKIWKGWKKTPFSILLITPQNEFLINHSKPSQDFTKINYDKDLKTDILRRKQNFNPSFLATFPAVNGISTVVVGQAENTWVKTSTPWTVTLLHEHFHQFQNTQPNYYAEVNSLDLANGDTTGMWMLNYPFPYSEKIIQEKFAKLSGALANLLENSGKKIPKEKIDQYLALRKDFQNSLNEKDYRYFSFQLWQEGVARYSEYRVAKIASENYKPSVEFVKLKDFTSYRNVAEKIYQSIIKGLKTTNLAEYKRESFYPFGAGEALLLDKVNPKWQRKYNLQKFYLEKYFEK